MPCNCLQVETDPKFNKQLSIPVLYVFSTYVMLKLLHLSWCMQTISGALDLRKVTEIAPYRSLLFLLSVIACEYSHFFKAWALLYTNEKHWIPSARLFCTLYRKTWIYWLYTDKPVTIGNICNFTLFSSNLSCLRRKNPAIMTHLPAYNLVEFMHFDVKLCA